MGWSAPPCYAGSEADGFTNLLVRSRSELDLTDRAATFDFILESRPQVIVDAAARVGGIMANSTYPADFLSENLQIQVNLLDAAVAARVPRLLFLGSSCIYPKYSAQPIKESALLTGPLEPTNDAYAIAKIAGILQVQAVRRQYGLPWISAMPTNLYGPGDNFSPSGSHLVPALIRRYEGARASGAPEVTNWGTGTPRRELLHVDDLASACLYLLEGKELRAVTRASCFAAVIHWPKPKEPEVSERALAFVEEWIADHVTAKDAEGDIKARAKALADQCLADANKGGVPASEIGEAIDDLPDLMIGAIDEAQERDEHADRFEIML